MADHRIEAWSPDHPQWPALVHLITAEKQTHWAFAPFFEAFPRHFLVALNQDEVVGFLMFVVWEIGPHDRDHPPMQYNGQTLTEAKIIAFGVSAAHRRRGIGRSLQAEALQRAKALGCYQVRSVSDHTHPANQQLKLSMGFAVEPLVRQGQPCLAFVMPLWEAGDGCV